MSVQGNNATPPAPAIAPGAGSIDTRAVARVLGSLPPDPRLTNAVPTFDAPFFQAGLAGYSDAAMRIVARRHGCPHCVTEALLDRMLLGGGRGFDKADLELLRDNTPDGDEDHPLSAQIIGSDPDEMAAAALKVIEQGARSDRAYRDLAYAGGSLPQYVDSRWRVNPSCADEDCGVDLSALDAGDHGGGRNGEAGEAGGAGGSSERRCEAIPLIASPPTTNARDGAASSPAASFQVIDVNLACPVKKIDRKNRGGHWLAHPGGAIDILRAVRAAVPAHIPCTVKLRRAYDDTPEMARNFEIIFDAAFELDYAWATVHARTVEQKYIGPSRWTFLRDLTARRPDCTVLGSGDVWDVHDIFRMIAYTAAPPPPTHTPPARSRSARTGAEVPSGAGPWPDPDAQAAPELDEMLEGVRARRGVAGVAVARGCIGNPWVFRQAREIMAGREPTPPTLAQQRRVLWEHFALSAAVNGERAAGKLMRKFGIRFSAHHPTPEPVRQRMIAVNSTADWLGAITEFYPEHADDAG